MPKQIQMYSSAPNQPEYNYQLALADQLMKQGTDNSPVHTPIGAAARALTGVLGGYIRKQGIEELEGAQKERRSQLMAAMLEADKGGDFSSIAQWVPADMHDQMFMLQMQHNLGSKEATQQFQRQMSMKDYEAGLQNPKAINTGDQQILWQAGKPIGTLQNTATPGTRRPEYEYDESGRVIGLNPVASEFQTRKAQAGAPNVQTFVNTAQDKFAETFGKENASRFFERRDVALDAAKSLNAAGEARNLLDSGVITGFGADFKIGFGKALQSAGINFNEDAIANTEAFAASRAQEVASIIKQFGAGTGLSDADREFAERAAAGKITMTEPSIRRIIDLNERASQNIIQQFNDEATRIPQGYSPYPLTIDVPTAQNPAQPNSNDPLGLGL